MESILPSEGKTLYWFLLEDYRYNKLLYWKEELLAKN